MPPAIGRLLTTLGLHVTGDARVDGRLVGGREISAPDFAIRAPGLGGRYRGYWAHAGPPTATDLGNGLVGDVGFDLNGVMWFCTVAGGPGTWIAINGDLFYYCRAHQSVSQSFAASTDTLLHCDVKDDDPNGNYSTGTFLYTAPLTGRYRINIKIRYGGTSLTGEGVAGVYIGVSSGAPTVADASAVLNAAASGPSFSGVIRANAGQVIGGHGWQNSSGAVSTDVTFGGSTLAITYEGP